MMITTDYIGEGGGGVFFDYVIFGVPLINI